MGDWVLKNKNISVYYWNKDSRKEIKIIQMIKRLKISKKMNEYSYIVYI